MKKRIILLTLVLMLCLSLVACGADPVKKVTDEIAAIGEVKASSQEAIQFARESFDALSEKQQAKVENADVLVAAEAALADALKVKEVEDLISDIGTVTIDSLPAIEKAENALAALPAELQEKVENAWLIDSARSEYQDCIIIKDVEDVIAALPANPTMADRTQVEDAREAFAALQPKHQGLVKNYAALTAAEEVLAPLCHAEAENILKSFYKEEDFVRGMSFYYPAAFPRYTEYWAADQRSFVLPYVGRDAKSVWLRLVCNYTDDDWVFFKKITFAVDSERIVKTFDYFDVTRDNDSGDVWEYVDLDVYSSEVKLLQQIADSTTTVVRFEGDNYYRDVTISAKDKEAIRQCLEVYTLLNY